MNKGKVLARLATYLRPYWRQTAALCVMILTSAALGLVAPYLTRPLMDVVLARRGRGAAAGAARLVGLIVLGMLAGQICAQGIQPGAGKRSRPGTKYANARPTLPLP